MSMNLTVEAASRLSSRATDFGRGMFGFRFAKPTWTFESMQGAGLEGNIVLRISCDVGTVICVRRMAALAFTQNDACWLGTRMADDGRRCSAVEDSKLDAKFERFLDVPG